MKSKFSKLAGFLMPAFLVLIVLFIASRNYTPGTYLIGWDSLHPEFNFPEAFRRIWEGVWRGEQGVGAIAAHSHMSDWPRLVFLWLESFIFPASFLRYSYIFLCLLLGPLGVYFFLKYVFQNEKESLWVYPAAGLGALFYLLNLGTLQNFYVPFEMFPAAFAFTPWLIFAGLKFLRLGGKKNLMFFALVVILSSPMAYAATLWYTTFAGLFIFFALFSIISSDRKDKLKRFLILTGVSIFLNLYWILPNFYSLVYQSGIIANAQTNLLFSPEAFFRNRDYGDFKDIALQKNFLFGWRNFDFAGNQFTNLLGVWIKYFSDPVIAKIGYIFAGFSLFGLLLTALKREKTGLALSGTLVFALFFLININPPTGAIYAYLYNNYGVFGEAFRMPFTKFSVLFELAASFYFGYFAFVFLSNRSQLFSFVRPLFFVGIVAALIYFMLPAFKGWLIGPNVRKPFPSEYLQVFQWFNSNQPGRIAVVPINSKYGWEYRNWGYEGSGFLTYGVSNPILYRDFDRWSSYNEDLYNQASSTLYGNNPDGFLLTLKKYQVKYLLLDESVINPGGTADQLYLSQIKSLIADSGVIHEVTNFGFLTVYQTDFDTGIDGVSAPREEIENTPMPLITGGLIVSENLSVDRGFPNAYNCDLIKEGQVFKENSNEGLMLSATGSGVSCDYLMYPDLSYNKAYILRVAGQNIEGRSLKIYFTNMKTEVADLEELLPEGHFDKTFYIYPSKLEEAGYVLNVESRAFGRIASKNILTKVEIYDAVAVSPKGEFAIGNNLNILNVRKYGTWAYRVDVRGDGLLQLGQGYDKGWIAFEMPNNKLQITNVRPLEHVKVNSWANGWVVPQDNGRSIYIIFWPQILEWGGTTIGVITLVIIFVKNHP